MKKTLFLLMLPILIGFCACNRLTPEEAKETVIAGVKDQVPLLVQQLFFVDDITVDSMHIIVDQEPMSGYLYTTWITKDVSMPIIVNVTDIHRSKEAKGYIEWMADWESAGRAYIMNTMLGDMSPVDDRQDEIDALRAGV